jgi:Phage integrase, N-terminal SAM-like domain
LQTNESHLRLHLRPYFGGRRLGAISVQVVRRWQHELEATASYDLTMACRSVLFRIMQAAEDDYLIPFNPVRKVKAPKRPVDPEAVFGRVRRRAYTPEEFGLPGRLPALLPRPLPRPSRNRAAQRRAARPSRPPR